MSTELQQAIVALERSIQRRDDHAARMRTFLVKHVTSEHTLNYSTGFKEFIQRAFPLNMSLSKAIAAGRIIEVFDLIRLEVKKAELAGNAFTADTAMSLWLEETTRTSEQAE